MLSLCPAFPTVYSTLPHIPSRNSHQAPQLRKEAWERVTRLYFKERCRHLLGKDGASDQGSQIKGFEPLLPQLVIPAETKSPIALEPDLDWGDTDRGFFAKRPALQHNKIFSAMFNGADDLDQRLAEDASHLTPAAVLQRLFETKLHFAEVLAEKIETGDTKQDVEPGSGEINGPDTQLDEAVSAAQDGTRSRLQHDCFSQSLPAHALDLLVVQFADVIHQAVEEQCRQNLRMGLGGDAKGLEALPEHFTLEDLLGAKLLRCGRSKSTHDTAEELQEDGSVVILFFGCSREAPSAKFARKLRAVYDRILRTGGKHSNKPLEVVYVPTGDTQMEYDRFTLREAGGWWAPPYEASSLLGQRAARRFGVQGSPHAVVLQWSAEKGHTIVVNADAEHEIANDAKGERYPWPVQSVDEMLGKVLLDHEMKNFKRTDVITAGCKVLAIYFGGEWCAAHHARPSYPDCAFYD
jgi:hypothetical protein